MRFSLKKTSISLPAVLPIAVSVLAVLSGLARASARSVEDGQRLFKSKPPRAMLQTRVATRRSARA